MKVKVSLAGDVCLPWPVSMTIHDGIAPPPPAYPPGSPLPCFEPPTPMMWPFGFCLRQNKLTTTVLHKTQSVVLGGHDCGVMIPHLTIPPANLKLGLIMAFSSRRVMFASSTVKANGQSIGCTDLYSSPVSLPMQCCAWPVPFPSGFPPLNSLNTVSVGLGLGDIVAGYTAILTDIVGGALLKNLRPQNGGLTGLAARLVGASTPKEWALKSALGVLVGAARIAHTREGKLGVEIGSAYAGLGLSVEYRREGSFAPKANAHALGLDAKSSSPPSWGPSL